MKRFLKDKRGSSSVLIILILLSLTTFSVLAVMSAYSDVKLARKSLTSAKSYYALDTLGERLLGDVYTLVDSANTAAERYVAEGGYQQRTHSELPAALAGELNDRYGGSSPTVAEQTEIRTRVTRALILEGLPESDQISVTLRPGLSDLSLEAEFSHDEHPGKYLSVSIAFLIDTDGLVHTDILSWRQWQDAFDYTENVYEVWGG